MYVLVVPSTLAQAVTFNLYQAGGRFESWLRHRLISQDRRDLPQLLLISILIYLRANVTAQRPITKLAGVRRKKQQQNTHK
jgi:hypothetical protein